jgi:hypothetical protein
MRREGAQMELTDLIRPVTSDRWARETPYRRDYILESYLRQLRSEFEAIDPAMATSARPEEAAAYARLKQYVDDYVPPDDPAATTPTASPEWWMVYKIERALIRTQSEVALRAKQWGLEEEYVYFAGQDRFDRLKNSLAKQPDQMNLDELREYLDALLREIHWLDTVRPAPYRKRKEILRSVGSLLSGLLCALFVLLMVAWFSGSAVVWPWWLAWLSWTSRIWVPPLVFVVVAGAMGALVSFTQRVQSAPAYLNPLADLYELSRQRAMVPLLVASGILGALLLYVSVCAHLIEGSLFPTIHSSPTTTSSVDTLAFLTQTGPESGTDYAKLLLWSFVAGFSERFIPNTLQRFIGKIDTPSEP